MRERLEKFEKPPKDSGNSSTPPSKEPVKSEIERLTKSLRKKYSAYFAIDFLNNQICLAHLLRNLEYLNDIDKEQTWAKEEQELLREAIYLRDKYTST